MISFFHNRANIDEQRILSLSSEPYSHAQCLIAVRFLRARRTYSGSYTRGLIDVGFWFSKEGDPVRLGCNHIITVRAPTDPACYPLRYYEEEWSVMAGSPQVLAELVFLHELYHHISHDHHNGRKRSTRRDHMRGCGSFILGRMKINGSILLPGARDYRVAARTSVMALRSFKLVDKTAAVVV